MAAEILDACELECPDEKFVQSELSPGTIQNQEKLGRFLYLEDHINERGGIAPAAFQIDDLIKSDRKGISVIRLDIVDSDELFEVRAEFSDRIEGVQELKLCVAATKEIRNIRIGSRRAFCVVDDAYPKRKAHALIRLENMTSLDRRTVRRFRECLIKKFAIA